MTQKAAPKPMPTQKSHFPDLERVLSASPVHVVGAETLTDTAHAQVVTAFLRVYGDEPTALCYIEPLIPTSDHAPDIVFVHPRLGVLVVEVKAYELDFIVSAEAGALTIRRGGALQQVYPLRQAQRAMYALKAVYEQRAYDPARPLFNSVVALPNISEKAWLAAGYDDHLPRRSTLFADEIFESGLLETRLGRLVHQTLALSGLAQACPPTARETLLRAFGASSVLNKPPRSIRPLPYEGIGSEIDRLENAHKQLSPEQQVLIRADVWGHPYLLRGVAGSGKSLVMAYQAAGLVLRQARARQQLSLFDEAPAPPPKIAIVCAQRTLVPLLSRYLSAAYADLSGEALPTEALHINHLNGLMYHLAEKHPHFHYVPMAAGRGVDGGERSRAYLVQLDSMTAAELDELRFDALFVDEAQDLHPDTLTLLHTLTRPNPQTGERTLAIYYDDAQNIFGQPRPVWRDFGLNVGGGRSAFMTHCYRNSREIVELGLNVLLGSAADDQTRVQTRRYADVYTLKEKGLVEEKEGLWRVAFADPADLPPQVQVFQARPAQVEWAGETALQLINGEGVRPEDILILSQNAHTLVHLEKWLGAAGWTQTRVLGGAHKATADEALLQEGRLALATIASAKGYDAPVVLLLDVDQLPLTVIGRASFYVGVTRAKRYLWVAGVKSRESLLSEAVVVARRLFGGG